MELLMGPHLDWISNYNLVKWPPVEISVTSSKQPQWEDYIYMTRVIYISLFRKGFNLKFIMADQKEASNLVDLNLMIYLESSSIWES